MLSLSFLTVAVLILVALAFDFMNGFHDAANSIATVVSTRVLTPLQAVVWAAFFNFVAAFGFGVAVASTIGKGIVHPDVIDNGVLFAAVGAAFLWDYITWHYGLPSSSSHALIAGLAGAGFAKAGPGVLVFSGLTKVVLFIVVSPLIGFVLGGFFMLLTLRLLGHGARPATVDRVYRRLQLLSAALYSLGHGTNDAQKTMGIIAVLLYSNGYMAQFHVPFWVVLLCHAAIAAGTLLGGWRIVRTMGMRLTALTPVGGFCAETAGAIALIGSSKFGIPVSTTHTITGAIVGVGSIRRFSAVRWGVAGNVVVAWVLTIPCTALIAMVLYLPFRGL
jgi:PiT family inorganic phosphate transporter